jgi:hypothetical protein
MPAEADDGPRWRTSRSGVSVHAAADLWYAQRRYVVPLALGVGHRQVDVDDGLRGQPRDCGGAHVLKLQHPPAQGLTDPAGEVVVLPGPGGVGVGYLDVNGRGGAGQPWIGSGRWRGVVERHDLGSAGHQCSLLPAHRHHAGVSGRLTESRGRSTSCEGLPSWELWIRRNRGWLWRCPILRWSCCASPRLPPPSPEHRARETRPGICAGRLQDG